MVFQKNDNVMIKYYGQWYAGTVESVQGDADNPEGYGVLARQYWGQKKGKSQWRSKQQESFSCTPDQVYANTSPPPAGFA